MQEKTYILSVIPTFLDKTLIILNKIFNFTRQENNSISLIISNLNGGSKKNKQ